MSSDSNANEDGEGDREGLGDREQQALHEVESGLEWVHRAHGELVAFHHAIGRAIDHFDDAYPILDECGHEDLAARIRDDQLPRGVLDDSTWTYDLLEDFQDGFLADVESLEAEVREQVADGQRHVVERERKRAWKERARKE